MAASASSTRRKSHGLSLAYNTNGFAHHCLEDIFKILKRLGYQGVALTLDANHLNPETTTVRAVGRTRRLLESLGLRVAVETGARFILDPFRKHHPSLLSRRGWRRRSEFVVRCLDIARGLDAEVVSMGSGSADPGADERAVMKRLAERCSVLADEAIARGVQLAFEPEPGMFIRDMEGYRRLRHLVDSEAFGLTLDLGHLHCMGEVPVEDRLEMFRDDLLHVHAEDMVRGVHEHLPFGRGEMDYRPIVQKLGFLDYPGLVAVELSRDSHRAVDAATEAIAFLTRLIRGK